MKSNDALFEELKKILINSGAKYDIDKIVRAYEYATMMHEGQYRKSGEDYITHPIEVAKICTAFGYDDDCICAALLHDTVEDCPDRTDMEQIRSLFGEEIAELVDGLTKLTGIRYDTKEEESIENLRKMFFAMSKDARVMFIKLCDRLHNMRTIESLPEHRQKEIALETMNIYGPVAHRLGMQKIKAELEDLSLKVLDPIGYAQIEELISRRYGESRDFLEHSQDLIKTKLAEAGIKFTMEGRVKTVNSLYRKMFMTGKPFEEVYDFYAIRLIVDDLVSVYMVLGIIHDLFSCIPERFKDYISTPKANSYQSLHTTVIGADGIPFEVQIRTSEMHEVAEYGVAAHWKYKTGEEAPEEIAKKLQWLRTLVEMDRETASEDYVYLLRTGIYSEEIFVYTPKGDVKNLPKGSTVIDFAYAIHSAVGNRTVGAKINGNIAPIDAELANGQIVEIITSKSAKGPNREWLSFVKTGEARNKIRQWFKKEKRAENILLGRDEVDRIFKRFNRAFTEQQKNGILENITRREGFTAVDDLYNAIGYGGVNVGKINFKIKNEIDRLDAEAEDQPITELSQIELREARRYSDNTIIIVDGLDNCDIKLSKCCNPLPGDDIAGFVTKGHGISVHKTDCPNYAAFLADPANSDRIKSVSWVNREGEQKSGRPFQALIKVSAVSDIRLFSALSNALADMKVSIHSIRETKQRAGGQIVIDMVISAKDLEHVNFIISRLKAIKNVTGAERGYI